MRFRVFTSLTVGLVLCSCGKLAQTDAAFTVVTQSDVSLRFKTDTFSAYSVRREPKLTAQEIGTDVPIGVAPARTEIAFTDRRPLPAFDKGPRYFLPARSYISFVPLEDKSVGDFQKSYPQVAAAVLELKATLKNRRTFEPKAQLPDLSSVDEEQAIHCKVAYIDLPLLYGIAFVTQYTQEEQGNPVNNEELTYNFQGLTKDGLYYIDARFAITHPSLPKGIDDANRIPRDKGNEYLRKAEKMLDSQLDGSFQPSIIALKDLLASIKTAAN